MQRYAAKSITYYVQIIQLDHDLRSVPICYVLKHRHVFLLRILPPISLTRRPPSAAISDIVHKVVFITEMIFVDVQVF